MRKKRIFNKKCPHCNSFNIEEIDTFNTCEDTPVFHYNCRKCKKQFNVYVEHYTKVE